MSSDETNQTMSSKVIHVICCWQCHHKSSPNITMAGVSQASLLHCHDVTSVISFLKKRREDRSISGFVKTKHSTNLTILQIVIQDANRSNCLFINIQIRLFASWRTKSHQLQLHFFTHFKSNLNQISSFRLTGWPKI